MAMLSLDEAQGRLLAMAATLPTETVAVEAALGRWLTAPAVARRTQPAADTSAMDGYAVRADDLAGPWRVVGESAAGHPFDGTLEPGEAVRIATGALVPAGAGAVIIQEDVTRAGDTVRADSPASAGRHIRRAGGDFHAGDAVMPAGMRIGPAQLALALSCGLTDVAVARRPRVVIVEGGDELAEPGADLPAHRIPASNGAMLAAMLAGMACEVTRRGPVPDDLDALAAALDAPGADVVVTSGGASVGDHDLVQPALARLGAKIAFWKVAIRPGKPLLVARRGAQIVLGLPGNPVSSLVTAQLFLMPLLRRLAGASACRPAPVRATLVGALPAGGARREFRRALWDGACVRDGSGHDSGALASLAACNALIDRPENAPAAATGDMVDVIPLEMPGIA